jgi:hypothetical protein
MKTKTNPMFISSTSNEAPKVNKLYRIHWRNKTTGRVGQGTKEFDRAKAEEIVFELNRDYPHIEHSAEEVR